MATWWTRTQRGQSFCFVFDRGGIQPRRSPDNRVTPNPSLLACMTNVLTSLNMKSNLLQVVLEQTLSLVENFVYVAIFSSKNDRFDPTYCKIKNTLRLV